MKDEDIIDAIRKGGIASENAIGSLYQQEFSLVPKMAYKFRGSLKKETISDLYTDVIIAFIDQVRRNKYQGKAKISAYLYSILKNKCIDAYKKKSTKKRRGEFVDEFPDNIETDLLLPDDQLIIKWSYSRLLCYISHLGDSCQQLLVDAYYWGYSRDEIAERMNFKDSRVVRSRLFTCKGQLKNLLNRSDICQELDPVEAE